MSENNNPEESDEVISQQLQDMGLLEEGMTPDDRRNLWSVLRLSKDTADAEEEDRQKRARSTVQYNQVSSRSAADDSQKQVSEGEQTKMPIVATVPPRQRNRSPSIIDSDEHVTSSCSSKIAVASIAPNSIFDTTFATETLEHSNTRTVQTLNTRELREISNVAQLGTRESDMTLQELADSETEVETEAEILKSYSRDGSISPKPVEQCSASSSPSVVKHKEHGSLTEESADNLMQLVSCGGKNADITKDVEDNTSALHDKSEDDVPLSDDVNPVALKDRERNIDAFTCDRTNYERTLKVRKVKRACARLPFYIPPYKMDVHTYIAYFKKCISEQAARLLEVQRRNHHCVPWGEPVVVGESDTMALAVMEQGEQKTGSILNLQRYNFRERKGAHQKVNTIYEDPDDDAFVTNTRHGTKTESNSTDDIFDSLLDQGKDEDIVDKDKSEDSASEDQGNLRVPAAERLNTMKRKSESNDVYIFQDEEEGGEKEDESSSWLSKDRPPSPKLGAKRKRLGPVMYNLRTKDNFVDDQEKEYLKKGRKRGRKGKRLQNKNKKRKQKNGNSRSGSEDDDDDDDDDDTIIFSNLDEAEGVGGSSRPGSRQEYDIRPGQLRLRGQGRRFVLQRKGNEENTGDQQEDDSEKLVEAAPMDDITVVYVASGSNDVPLLGCPICKKMFGVKDIEAHASECNEYCEEDISPCSSPEMIHHSAQNVISEECWSQYDNDHNHQASRRQKQQQQQQQQQQGTAETKHTPA